MKITDTKKLSTRLGNLADIELIMLGNELARDILLDQELIAYPMDDLDMLMSDMTPTEILEHIEYEFTVDDDYVIHDDHGMYMSFTTDELVDLYRNHVGEFADALADYTESDATTLSSVALAIIDRNGLLNGLIE